MCNKCEHRTVCWKYRATGGHVNNCKDFKKENVRCKDCRHFKPQNQGAHRNCITPYCTRSANVKVGPEDYCSHGERKDADG